MKLTECKPKFTKGGWIFNLHDGSITDSSSAKNHIAQVSTDDWDELGMGLSNGYLIASAPEMYMMLEKIMHRTRGGSSLSLRENYEIETLLIKALGNQ